MKTILHILEYIVTQPWFGPLILGPLAAWAVDFLFRHNHRFKSEVMKLMILVQKQYPDWDGEQKKAAVVKWIQQSNKFAAAIPASLIESLIDGVIDDIHREQQLEVHNG